MPAIVMKIRIVSIPLLGLALLTACSAAAIQTDEATREPLVEQVTVSSPLSVGKATSVAPTPPATQTPTPYPLSIEWLRSREYPSSEIVIEQTLAPGANYSRYIASYTSDGLKIFALLTIPFGEAPQSGWPTIVFNHGYIQPQQYVTTERYVAYVDALARSGYIVFRSDYRGHGNSEGIARGAYGYPDYDIDVLNAVAVIKEYPEADPDRIGMWGHSMGGYLTLRSMVVSNDIRAGVIWAGVVAPYQDFDEPWLRRGASSLDHSHRDGGWRSALQDEFGTFEDNPDFWYTLSANYYLDDLSGPIQLHHGTGDTHVPLTYTANLYDQLLTAGQMAEFYEYPGDNHNLSNYFSLAMQRSIQFFDEHLKGSAN